MIVLVSAQLRVGNFLRNRRIINPLNKIGRLIINKQQQFHEPDEITKQFTILYANICAHVNFFMIGTLRALLTENAFSKHVMQLRK
jgi:hypothetical protein